MLFRYLKFITSSIDNRWLWFLLIHALDLYPVATTHPNEEEMSSGAAIARVNRQIINLKFCELLTLSCKKLREKQINMKAFCLFLEGLFPQGDCIPESSSIDKTVFGIFEKYYTNCASYSDS